MFSFFLKKIMAVSALLDGGIGFKQKKEAMTVIHQVHMCLLLETCEIMKVYLGHSYLVVR